MFIPILHEIQLSENDYNESFGRTVKFRVQSKVNDNDLVKIFLRPKAGKWQSEIQNSSRINVVALERN
jgi:hypothetical protein